MGNDKRRVPCQWCGEIFEQNTHERYCSEVCRLMARDYIWTMKTKDKSITADVALWHWRESNYGKAPKPVEVPTEKVIKMVVAPVKVTSSATQWRVIPESEVDRNIRIIKGGKSRQ